MGMFLQTEISSKIFGEMYKMQLTKYRIYAREIYIEMYHKHLKID